MNFKRNVTARLVFDFAALADRIQGVLLAASAFQFVGVVFM